MEKENIQDKQAPNRLLNGVFAFLLIFSGGVLLLSLWPALVVLLKAPGLLISEATFTELAANALMLIGGLWLIERGVKRLRRTLKTK